jgi:hypothetical protein
MSKNKNYVPTGNIALLQLLVQWDILIEISIKTLIRFILG